MKTLRWDLFYEIQHMETVADERTARLEAAQAALDAAVQLRCCAPSSFRRLPASGSKMSSSWLPAL